MALGPSVPSSEHGTEAFRRQHDRGKGLSISEMTGKGAQKQFSAFFGEQLICAGSMVGGAGAVSKSVGETRLPARPMGGQKRGPEGRLGVGKIWKDTLGGDVYFI